MKYNSCYMGATLALLMASTAVAQPVSHVLESPRVSRPNAILVQTEEPAQAEPKAEAEPEKPARKPRKAAAEAPQTEEPAQAEPNAEGELEKPARKPRKAAAEAPQTEEPAQAEPNAEGEPERPARKPRKAAAEAPQTEEPAQAEPKVEAEPEKPARKSRKAAAEAPQTEEPAQAEPNAEGEPEKPARKPRKAAAEASQTEEPAQAEPNAEGEPKPARKPRKAATEAPLTEEPAQAVPNSETGVASEPVPAGTVEPKPEGKKIEPGLSPDQAKAPDDGVRAPMFDSAKRESGPRRKGRRATEPDATAAPAAPEAESAPPPASDRAAQAQTQSEDIQSVTAEKGLRRDVAPDDRHRERKRPSGSEVLREIGDRLIIELGDQLVVESSDRPRMSRGAREVYYEDLPRGRTRETIVRPDGTRVVTVRNAYGDVIRRSRITTEDREEVLSYVDEDNFDRTREWLDPGLDLPPMRVDIPEDEYIMDAGKAEDTDAYYDFLEQPPVEKVERLYSVDEVKRSARIRDKTRRVDLDTLTFEFGSATIPEEQIPRLDALANAIEKMLAKNPAETFLIEGHTDAIGSDLANLALSDRRAEAVADALSNVFAIPAENISTQGYGEQYLKVRTQSPERQNRRVAVRRITPLVAPVASAE